MPTKPCLKVCQAFCISAFTDYLGWGQEETPPRAQRPVNRFYDFLSPWRRGDQWGSCFSTGIFLGLLPFAGFTWSSSKTLRVKVLEIQNSLGTCISLWNTHLPSKTLKKPLHFPIEKPRFQYWSPETDRNSNALASKNGCSKRYHSWTTLSFEPCKTVHALSQLSCSEWLSRVEWLLLGLQRSGEKNISWKSITAQHSFGLGGHILAPLSVNVRAKWKDQINVKWWCWLGMRWMDGESSWLSRGQYCDAAHVTVWRKITWVFSLTPVNFSGTHCFSFLQVFLASATAGSTASPLNAQ